MTPPKKTVEEPLTLSVEERRRRVEAVRGVDSELATIEAALLDVQARVPGVISRVQGVRGTISRNTSTPTPAEEPPD